jgi:tRNA/rRNA methyltransferase
MAAGGKSIIENATVFDTVAAAAHDITFLAATSARRRDLSIQSANPRTAAEMIATKASTGKAALLFGPEASGLDNDEVVLADVLVTASLNPAYPSLNLAQGVLVMAWEWRMAALAVGTAPASPLETAGSDGLATVAERDYFFKRLETALDDGGFFTAPDMMATVKRNIRALYTRAALSKQELSTLHGVVQALTSKRKN